MLKSDDESLVINNYIENDPLSENNLNKTLDLVNKIRLSSPRESIWLYTGYTWDEIFGEKQFEDLGNGYCQWTKRAAIAAECDVLVDGRYMKSQRNITLAYRGSANQRVIDIKKSLQQGGKTILWCN